MWRHIRALLRRGATRRPSALRVADLQDGQLVRVVGRARGVDGPLPVPLSHGDAVSFTVRVYEWQPAVGLMSHRTTRLIDDMDFGQAFWIDDGTGIARVERQGWSELVGIRQTKVGPNAVARMLGPGGRGGRAPVSEDKLERYFAYFGKRARRAFRGFEGEYEYEELVVPADAEVEVTGRARRTDEIAPVHAPGGYRTAPRLFVIEPSDRDPLCIRVRG